MDGYEAWLQAMPVDDVRHRIAELERELEVMRLLERQHRQQRRPEEQATPPTTGSVHMPSGRARRMSPEREAIVAVLQEHPEGASPAEVASALGKEQNPIQTNMSRMVKAGQLERVEQGRYKLPPTIQTDAPQQEGRAVLDAFQPAPSGSEVEAMKP